MTKQFDPTRMTITTTEFLALVGNLEAAHGMEVDPSQIAEAIAASLVDDILPLTEVDEITHAPDVLATIQRRALQARAALKIWERHRRGEEPEAEHDEG